MMKIVIEERDGGIEVMDGVYNDFSDRDGLEEECEKGEEMGFEGKKMINKGKIEEENREL